MYTFLFLQPESAHTDRAVVDKMIGWPILDIFIHLLRPDPEITNVLDKAKQIIVKTWGKVTSIEQRKAALKEMNHEDVSQSNIVLACFTLYVKY